MRIRRKHPTIIERVDFCSNVANYVKINSNRILLVFADAVFEFLTADLWFTITWSPPLPPHACHAFASTDRRTVLIWYNIIVAYYERIGTIISVTVNVTRIRTYMHASRPLVSAIPIHGFFENTHTHTHNTSVGIVMTWCCYCNCIRNAAAVVLAWINRGDS